jgi:serine/threonine protein kinase
MAVAPGSLLGRYQILSPLGAGGMGEVYLAKDTQLGRQVAIKFPTVNSDEHHTHARFLREARSVSALSHRNIATVYDYGETKEDYGETKKGQPYLVMELIRGESLSDLMHSSALTLSRSVEIIAAVAEALAEAHKHGIIHRDIKPSNVMINERGEVKVLDFGLAKQLYEEVYSAVNQDAETLLATTTKSGMVVGTPLYLSPEQATSGPVDARSDIFALGSLFYECITGRSAFSGKSVIEITAQIIHVDPPPPSTINPRVPPELDRITLKALAKSPEERYQSAEEMLKELHAVHAFLDETVLHQTRRLIKAPKTLQSSAFNTISEGLRRPRLSLAFFVLAIAAIITAIIVYNRVTRPKLHQPSVQAQKLFDKGVEALREGAYYQASLAFEQAVAADNQFALAHARLAEALMELDYIERARNELLLVSQLVPDRSALMDKDKFYLDAVVATVSRDFPRAVRSYEQISNLSPDQPQAFVDLGRAYETNEETAKAIDSYRKATSLDGTYAAAFLRVGILYGRQQELPSAAAAFDKAEQLYQAAGNVEGRTEVLFQRGALSLSLGKHTEARMSLQQALEMSRVTNNQAQQIKVLLQLALALQSGGDSA